MFIASFNFYPFPAFFSLFLKKHFVTPWWMMPTFSPYDVLASDRKFSQFFRVGRSWAMRQKLLQSMMLWGKNIFILFFDTCPICTFSCPVASNSLDLWSIEPQNDEWICGLLLLVFFRMKCLVLMKVLVLIWNQNHPPQAAQLVDGLYSQIRGLAFDSQSCKITVLGEGLIHLWFSPVLQRGIHNMDRTGTKVFGLFL